MIGIEGISMNSWFKKKNRVGKGGRRERERKKRREMSYMYIQRA